MNIVTVPGWELTHFQREHEHLQMAWSPLFEENMGLDCWCLNIFPPKDHVFWHFGKYRHFSIGEHHFGQSLANDEVKRNVDTLLFEYFDDYALGNLYLSGLTRFFGDAFLPVEHGHISVVVPPKLRGDCENFFVQMHAHFGAQSTLAIPSPEPDFSIELSLILGAANDGARPTAALSAPVNTTTRIRTHAAHRLRLTPPPDDCEAGFESLYAKLRWICANMPLSVVEACKHSLNDASWGGASRSAHRNRFRALLDHTLAPHPIVQTNPFERWLGHARFSG